MGLITDEARSIQTSETVIEVTRTLDESYGPRQAALESCLIDEARSVQISETVIASCFISCMLMARHCLES